MAQSLGRSDQTHGRSRRLYVGQRVVHQARSTNGQSRRRGRMKIYLATRFTRRGRMMEYRSTLHANGHEVTSRWLDFIDTLPDEAHYDAEKHGLDGSGHVHDPD